MKLIFFTPAAKSSAIGRMAKLVVSELIAGSHDVTVVRSEDISALNEPIHDFSVKILKWNEADAITALAADADAVVYQIGNSYNYHRGCIEWLPKLPGVVCLHDYFLGHLFWGWAENRRKNAKAVLNAFYGGDIAESYFHYKNSNEFIEATRIRAPMTEWIASMATGVIIHSNWDVQRILDSCPGPVETVPLPYDIYKGYKPMEEGQSSESYADDNNGHSSGEFTVLTIGHINPNKRTESVIRAIGGSNSLGSKVCFKLTGAIEPDIAGGLSALAAEQNVKLLISGEVDDAGMAKAIEQADVMCCLRLPALESASASTIESMLYGKPTIVTDTGFYSGLPDDCVIKISPDNEIIDLLKALEFLYRHPEERFSLGRRASEYATATFSAVNYADRLVDLSKRAAFVTPFISAVSIFADTLVRWGASVDSVDKPLLKETLLSLRIFE